MFSDRKDEMNSLRQHYNLAQEKSQLLVIYGRRRVGKTTLVKEFLKEKKGAYIFIEPKSEELILKDCEEVFEKIIGYRPRFDSWETLFEISQKEKIILIMDEFQNLGIINTHIFAKIQKIWDGINVKPGLLFITIGSYVGMIKKLFRDGKQPLFGRATGMMRLEPFDVFNTVNFLKERGLNFYESIEGYTVFGGVPRYLLELKTKRDNIKYLFFGTTSYLKEEGMNILSLEFGSQHKGYFSVLESLSKGKVTPKEISDYAGMNIATVSKYLAELMEEYEIVMSERPTAVKNRKLVRYRIKDNFFDFWFKNIYSKASLLEIDPEYVFEQTNNQLPQIISRRMEDVIKDIIIKRKLFISPTEIGRWWNRTGEEIDVVAIDERKSEILFVEIKWTNKTLGANIIDDLCRKSKLVQWRNGKRYEKFLIISKSGFTTKFKEKCKENNIYHWDIKEIESIILS